MKRFLVHFLTFLRIVAAFLLLFPAFAPFSSVFLLTYTLGGITDMADGYLARRWHTAGAFGTVFDSVADLAFTVAALLCLWQVMAFPVWLVVWGLLIAVGRLGNFMLSFRHRPAVPSHSVGDKITGVAVFLLPYMRMIWISCLPAATACLLATLAVIQKARDNLQKTKLMPRQS